MCLKNNQKVELCKTWMQLIKWKEIILGICLFLWLEFYKTLWLMHGNLNKKMFKKPKKLSLKFLKWHKKHKKETSKSKVKQRIIKFQQKELYIWMELKSKPKIRYKKTNYQKIRIKTQNQIQLIIHLMKIQRMMFKLTPTIIHKK